MGIRRLFSASIPATGGLPAPTTLSGSPNTGFPRSWARPFTRYGLIHGRIEGIAHNPVDEPANVERAHQLVHTARITLEERA